MAPLTSPLPSVRPHPSAITCALDSRGFDGPEVDEALGVNDALDTVVDAWEAGTLVPTSDDVRRLAMLTGYSPHFFYRPAPEAERVFICGRGATSEPTGAAPS